MTKAKAQNAGRKNNNERIRELVALLGSLSKTGDTVSIEAISSRLGITFDDARMMMDIVCQASGEEMSGLLISSNEDESEYTLQFPGVTGKPIRLTPAETIALLHALDVAGVPEEDPIRAKINDAFSSPKVTAAEVRKALGATHENVGPLAICAQSQVEQRELLFTYQGLRDERPRRRRALIRGLRTEGDAWYALGVDLDLDQDRTFRLDRMTDPSLGEVIQSPSIAASDTPTRVGITFEDPLYYYAFDWPGLSITRNTGKRIEGNIVYYGESSTWLLQRICAGNGSITVDSECIMQRAAEYARKQLQS